VDRRTRQHVAAARIDRALGGHRQGFADQRNPPVFDEDVRDVVVSAVTTRPPLIRTDTTLLLSFASASLDIRLPVSPGGGSRRPRRPADSHRFAAPRRASSPM